MAKGKALITDALCLTDTLQKKKKKSHNARQRKQITETGYAHLKQHKKLFLTDSKNTLTDHFQNRQHGQQIFMTDANNFQIYQVLWRQFKIRNILIHTVPKVKYQTTELSNC